MRASYLASPPLVVAYALAGSTGNDLVNDPLGTGSDGRNVYLADIWPSSADIEAAVVDSVTAEMFKEQYSGVFSGNETWNKIPGVRSELYQWDPDSTYVREPPLFTDMTAEPQPITDITDARVLVKVGDSVTTDHISPAGAIAINSPAGQYLLDQGVASRDFNSYGSRRGNDQIVTRGGFANIRMRNQMAPGTEGGWTTYLPEDEVMWIYDASLRYQEDEINLLVLAGEAYGTGSSRDQAAKATLWLGGRFVITASFERIHRSNLVYMGVLPLEFKAGENADSLGLDGTERYSTMGLDDNLQPGQDVPIRVVRSDGSEFTFQTTCRIDTPVEVDYYRNGGILQTVLRKYMQS